MTFEEFVNQYTSFAINNIPIEDMKLILQISKNVREGIEYFEEDLDELTNMRFLNGLFQSTLGRPYREHDYFRHEKIFEWRDIRDTLSDFKLECDFDVDIMSVL